MPDVAYCGEDGEDGELFQAKVAFWPGGVGKEDVWVLVVVEVVDAEVDGSFAVFKFLVPVEAYVHTVVVGHAVVVA